MTTTTPVSNDQAPVQLLGLGTSLDVNSIETELSSIDQIPLTLLQNKVTSYQSEVSAYGQLSSALSTFQSSLASLQSGSAFQTEAVNVGDSSVASATLNAAGSGPQATVGTHSLAVSQLAQTQVTASGDFANTSATVGTGTITIQLGTFSGTDNSTFTASTSAAPTTITIDSNSSSLQGIVTAINSANAGVTASIVNDGTGSRLVLSSSTTGSANGFEVTVNDSDGNNTDDSGLSSIAYDPTASGGTPQTTLLQSAQNANLTLDGIAITSATNSVDNALQGVSLNLTGTTTSPTTLSVTSNTSTAANAVSGFVTQYNAFQATLQALTLNQPNGTNNGVLAADPTATLIGNDLQNIVESLVNTGDPSIQTLGDIGITIGTNGTLSLNSATLDNALASDPTAVSNLFAASGSSTDSLISYDSASSSTQPGNYALNISSLATQATLAGSGAANLTITTGTNDTFDATIDGITAEVTVPAGTYTATSLAAAVQTAINSTPAFTAAGISVNVTQANGVLSLTSNTYGSTSTISVDSGAGSQGLFGTTPTSSAGTDVAGTLGGQAFVGSGQNITGAANTPAAGLALTVDGGTTGARGTVSYSLGIAAQLNNTITQDLDPTNGVIAAATNSLNSQITNVQSQETAIQANITVEEQTMQAEFTAMTELVDSLNNTSSFLTQEFGTGSSSSSSSSSSNSTSSNPGTLSTGSSSS